MYVLGFTAGLFSAILASCSYVASKGFINRYKSPLRLMALSLVFMMIPAALTLLCLMGRYELIFTQRNILMVLGAQASFVLGQFALFRALHYVEASRYSSLLGLKILVLSLIYVGILREPLSLQQWIAVILCTISAVGINYSGLRIPLKAFVFLLITLSGYICSDICHVEYIKGNIGTTPLIQAFASISFSYICLGLITLPTLFFFKWTFREFGATAFYGGSWFLSMLTLFFCFYQMGLVYGSVLQATRGLFSIVLGALLVYYKVPGHEAAETSRKDWIRRIVMAILMIIAVGLYAGGK
ncbi:MAG: EamA family transporter [Lentisphaeria bacterium]|nr:EamA family transporter [Lentisphaeria bacterium]